MLASTLPPLLVTANQPGMGHSAPADNDGSRHEWALSPVSPTGRVAKQSLLVSAVPEGDCPQELEPALGTTVPQPSVS